MQYDPIKDRVERVIRMFPVARVLFYRMLDLLLLRQRYVKRSMLKYAQRFDKLRYYDAGAGFCQYSWFMLRRFTESSVFATDLKSDYLDDFADFAEASYKGRFTWQTADLQIYQPQGTFHLITAIDILEHIEDDVSVLNIFSQCLVDNGILIISTPSDTDEAAKFTEEHVRPGYNKTELETKLRDSGFDILESLYSYGTWGSLAWRMIIKHPLSLMAKSKLAVLILPVYYLLVFPIAELLMRLDLKLNNKTGTGIIIVAQKREC